eukprot:10478-Heterococcus_DN1.PRE.1
MHSSVYWTYDQVTSSSLHHVHPIIRYNTARCLLLQRTDISAHATFAKLLHCKTATQSTITESAEKRPRSCSASTSPLRQRAASRIGYAAASTAITSSTTGNTTAVRHRVTASVSPQPVRTTHTSCSSSSAGTGTAAATTLRTSSCNVAAFQSLCLSSATVVSTVVPTVELPKHVLAAIATADAAAAAAANSSTSSSVPRALCSAGSSST